MKSIRLLTAASLCMALLFGFVVSAAAGPFGAPEPAVKEKGYRVGIGYWYNHDRFKVEDFDFYMKQNQTYVEIAKVFPNLEIMARIGASDVTAGADEKFSTSWEPFGTIGLKGYIPLGSTFGVGPILQATYYSDHKDNVPQDNDNLSNEPVEMKIRDFWDIRLGVAVQAKVTPEIKIYGGPFVYYSRARFTFSPDTSWIDEYTSETYEGATARNKSKLGGFFGVDLPLSKVLHVNLEGQYSERFSAGGSLSFLF